MGGSVRTQTLTALLCLGLCRGPWDQVQAGYLPKPSIRADPSPNVTSGTRVTIWCQASLQADVYYLYKERVSEPTSMEISQDSSNKASFSLGFMSLHNAGRYQCQYHSRNGWSQRSDLLPLVVTGLYGKPSLSAQPGPSVSWGESVTLQCRSEIWLDTFYLSKEGSPAPPQHIRLQDTTAPYQVNFNMSPVTSDHEGTYRCYASSSTSPYLLSHPSDPLELLVSGGSEDAPVTPWRGPNRYLYVLIGAAGAFVLLLCLLVVLLVRRQCQGKGRKPAAAATIPAPEDEGLRGSSGPAATAAQDENLYAVMKDTQAEEDRQLASQAVVSGNSQDGTYAQIDSLVSEDPQDVTYAQLNCLTLRRVTSGPASSQAEPPAEPSVYASLAIR